MAYAKREIFRDDDVQLADIAKALGHPARIAILKFLATKDRAICGEIVEKLPLSQSTVSQHIKELRAAHLIESRAEGPKMYYWVNNKFCDLALNRFHYMLNQLKI